MAGGVQPPEKWTYGNPNAKMHYDIRGWHSWPRAVIGRLHPHLFQEMQIHKRKKTGEGASEITPCATSSSNTYWGPARLVNPAEGPCAGILAQKWCFLTKLVLKAFCSLPRLNDQNHCPKLPKPTNTGSSPNTKRQPKIIAKEALFPKNLWRRTIVSQSREAEKLISKLGCAHNDGCVMWGPDSRVSNECGEPKKRFLSAIPLAMFLR